MGEGKMNLYQKIIEISNELRVAKDGKNKGIGFNYFNADDIANKLNPLMKKHGVFIKFEIVLKSGFEKENIYTSLVTVFDTDTDKSIEYQFDIKEAVVQRAQGAQATGATITYAKRYMLMNIFNIADNKDDPDAHLGDDDETPKSKKQQALDDLNAREEAHKEKMQQTMKKQSPVMDTLIDLVNEHIAVSTSILEKALAHFGVKRTIDLTDEQAQAVINAIKRDIKEK